MSTRQYLRGFDKRKLKSVRRNENKEMIRSIDQLLIKFGGSNHSSIPYTRKVETFAQQQQRQQQQQTVPHVATFVTSKSTGSPQIQQNCQPSIKVVSLHNLPPPAPCHPQIQTLISNPVTQLPEEKISVVQDIQNSNLKIEDDQSVNESKHEKIETKWPVKRKINKKEQKKRLNARMRRLVCPKSPLMVFSELYKDVPIKLTEHRSNDNPIYIASVEIDGEVYSGSHVSKTQAKQKACENFLRVLLAKKMSERPRPINKEDSFAETKMDNSDKDSTSTKPKGPPQEDFPWPHFASLAMHNLIAHWELQPVAKVMQEETNVKVVPKTSGMKKFPDNPEIYNPVQLLHQMTPGIQFTEETMNSNGQQLFGVNCELKGVKFSGQGKTKKAAKKECAIAAIKYFWLFDFHTIKK